MDAQMMQVVILCVMLVIGAVIGWNAAVVLFVANKECKLQAIDALCANYPGAPGEAREVMSTGDGNVVVVCRVWNVSVNGSGE